MDYRPDFASFARDWAAEAVAVAGRATLAERPSTGPEPRDDVLFMSAIPWVPFTAFHHPMPTIPSDSIPRFAWGKITGAGTEMCMPLEVQGHHALMDGIHMARWYEAVQDLFLHPEGFLP